MAEKKTKRTAEDLELSDNIHYNFYYWGPLLMKFKVSDSLCDKMLHRAEKLTIKEDNATTELVATTEKELNFKNEDTQFFADQTSKIFNTYLKYQIKDWLDYNQIGKTASQKKKGLSTRGLWINYMEKNDFNPIHEHFGDLSFVLFCDVPNEIKIENQKNKTRSSGAGSLSFLYGDGMPEYVCSQNFMPEKGDFFIFPSKLQHYVHPFKSDVTRISIAGNMDYMY